MKKNEKNIAKYLLEELMEIVKLFAYGVLFILFFLSVLAAEGDFGEFWKVPGMVVVITESTVMCLITILYYLSIRDEKESEEESKE